MCYGKPFAAFQMRDITIKANRKKKMKAQSIFSIFVNVKFSCNTSKTNRIHFETR